MFNITCRKIKCRHLFLCCCFVYLLSYVLIGMFGLFAMMSAWPKNSAQEFPPRNHVNDPPYLLLCIKRPKSTGQVCVSRYLHVTVGLLPYMVKVQSSPQKEPGPDSLRDVLIFFLSRNQTCTKKGPIVKKMYILFNTHIQCLWLGQRFTEWKCQCENCNGSCKRGIVLCIFF